MLSDMTSKPTISRCSSRKRFSLQRAIRVKQRQRETRLNSVHPFHGSRRTGDIVYHVPAALTHDLYRQHIVARQRQHVGDKPFIAHDAAAFLHAPAF